MDIKSRGSPLSLFLLFLFLLSSREPARPCGQPFSTSYPLIPSISSKTPIEQALILISINIAKLLKSLVRSVSPTPLYAHTTVMATVTVPPLCQVHDPRTSMTGSARCRCQNVSGCDVHAAGATTYTTGALRNHSEQPLSTRRTSSGARRVPQRKRRPDVTASITSTVGLETRMDQVHLQPLQSRNSPTNPSKGVCPAEDFVLFDEVSQRQSTLGHFDKSCPEDDNSVIIESIEDADRAEWALEDTHDLPVPPRPRPTRLPTPDFDDEIPPTFFPPLETVGTKQQNRPAIDQCQITMPVLSPLSNGK